MNLKEVLKIHALVYIGALGFVALVIGFMSMSRTPIMLSTEGFVIAYAFSLILMLYFDSLGDD